MAFTNPVGPVVFKSLPVELYYINICVWQSYIIIYYICVCDIYIYVYICVYIYIYMYIFEFGSLQDFYGLPISSQPTALTSAKPQHTQRQQREHGEHGNAIGARKKVDTKSWKMPQQKKIKIDQGSPDEFWWFWWKTHHKSYLNSSGMPSSAKRGVPGKHIEMRSPTMPGHIKNFSSKIASLIWKHGKTVIS